MLTNLIFASISLLLDILIKGLTLIMLDFFYNRRLFILSIRGGIGYNILSYMVCFIPSRIIYKPPPGRYFSG